MTKDDILYNTLKENGFEEFVNKGSGFWETITEAMQKYHKQQLLLYGVSNNEVKFFCRLHTSRKNCKEYRFNKNTCKNCPHFVEAK